LFFKIFAKVILVILKERKIKRGRKMNSNASFQSDENNRRATGQPRDPRDIPAKWINYSILAALYAVAVFLFWKTIALGQYNLIIAGITFILVLFIFPAELITAKWFTSLKSSRLLFAIATVFGFATSAVVSGSLDPSLKLPSVYLGCFHIHHWWWASGRLGGFLHLLFGPRIQNIENQKSFYRRHANFELVAGTIFLALFFLAFIEEHFYPNNPSFRIVSGCLGLTSLIWGVLLKTKAPYARGFKRVIAVFLGITTGIWLEGLMLGIIPKFGETINFWECAK
jgi:hypothetical protein